MNTPKHLKTKSLFLGLLLMLGLTCEKAKELTYEQKLTKHKWKLVKTESYWAGSSTVDPTDLTDNHTKSCEQDDYWEFFSDFDYEIHLGTSKCRVDEDELDDWGYWEFDFDPVDSDYTMLYTYSDNVDNIIPDIEYEVLELTKSKMVLRFGGCVDNTRPDTDGICVTLTFEKI